MTNKQTVFVQDLGQAAYKQTWDYQEQLLQENVARKIAAKEADEKQSTGYYFVKQQKTIQTLTKY